MVEKRVKREILRVADEQISFPVASQGIAGAAPRTAAGMKVTGMERREGRVPRWEIVDDVRNEGWCRREARCTRWCLIAE
jgi:hypothetical protein